MIADEVLALLCCPETRQPLRRATDAELAALLTSPPAGALVREDGRVAYPVRDGIPVLIMEEAIRMERP